MVVKENIVLEANFNVGLVQTTIDASKAWPKSSSLPRMSIQQDIHAWCEICKAMRSFQDGERRPEVVLFPELSIPVTRVNDFERLVADLNVIAVVGVDYSVDKVRRVVKNEGVVFVPNGFWKNRPSKSCLRIIFGKSYPAPVEKDRLINSKPSWRFSGDNNVYVFDLCKYGKVGISICYDFMDLERALMYRGEIHHLFVLAYNKDLGMFQSLADSLSRTIYCNVVVCNTGFYGGSLAVSPYYDSFKRKVYSHNGGNLYTTQVFELPLKELDEYMRKTLPLRSAFSKTKPKFKGPPPGMLE